MKRKKKPQGMYFNPTQLAREFGISRNTVYTYIDFIKKNIGFGKRYSEGCLMQRPGIGQRVHILAFLDAYTWKKAIEMGVEPDYNEHEMAKYLVKMGDMSCRR